MTDMADLAQYTVMGKFSSNTPEFCAVREILLPKLAVSTLSVQCLMLISDVLIKASSYQLCRRRTAILRTVQAMVGNYTSFLQQSTAVALSTLIVAECRAGNTGAARCHANALRTWIIAHGGLAVLGTFSTTMQVSLLMVLTYFNTSIFSTRAHFDKALKRLNLPRGQPIPSLEKYIYVADTGPQTALLYVLNLVLQHPKTGFHDRLRRQTAQCTKLAPGGLILIVAKIIEETFAGEERFSVVQAVEFVQLLSFATESTRTAVLVHLVDTLLGRTSGLVDVQALKEEIRHGYMKSLESSDDSGRKASATGLTLNVDTGTDSCSKRSPRCLIWAA